MQHDQAARPDAAWSRRPKVIRADRRAQTAAMPKDLLLRCRGGVAPLPAPGPALSSGTDGKEGP
jgi:hypothetical protein